MISNDCLNNVEGVSSNSFVYTVSNGEGVATIEDSSLNTNTTGPVAVSSFIYVLNIHIDIIVLKINN